MLVDGVLRLWGRLCPGSLGSSQLSLLLADAHGPDTSGKKPTENTREKKTAETRSWCHLQV